MKFEKTELQQMADSVPFWFHSIDLGEGVVTKGFKSAKQQEDELKALRLPDLTGVSVLDIGAWDGFFSFEAERRGAARVLALDHFVWSLDIHALARYWKECREQGITPKQPQTIPVLWHPSKLPGKRGFDTAHRALNSKVEFLVSDFMEMDLDKLGVFDVVLYLGVLYHMQNPFQALQRVAAVTGHVAIIESEAVVFPGFEKHAICEFFESGELQGDETNWWAPNEKALVGMCRAAGFKQVQVIVAPPIRHSKREQLRRRVFFSNPQVERYRAIVHAWK